MQRRRLAVRHLKHQLYRGMHSHQQAEECAPEKSTGTAETQLPMWALAGLAIWKAHERFLVWRVYAAEAARSECADASADTA